MTYVGTHGIQRSTPGQTLLVHFPDVASLDVLRVGTSLRGTATNFRESDVLTWKLRDGRTTTLDCEYQPALARGSRGLDHDRWSFGHAAENAWTAYRAAAA